MPKVIQIRDVPEEVRHALAAAAKDQGLSLTRFLRRELEQLARRPQVVRHNTAVVRRTQHSVGVTVDREQILSALEVGRSR